MIEIVKQVRIRAKSAYTAYIEDGLIKRSLQLIDEFCPSGRVVLVTESNLVSINLNYVVSALEQYGFQTIVHVFSGSEKDKNFQTANDIIDFFAHNRVNADDLVVAFGGGIVSDIAGFCASIYLRGISYAIIPTTFLSMIDACIGGKNGINNRYAKNQIGTYYHPKIVLCDTSLIKSLPEDNLRDGFAEAIKYAMIDDVELGDLLLAEGMDCDYDAVITRCITAKNHYIALDEYDKGKRMMLNFGHTIGHAIEQFSDYNVSHGKSVAMGMAMITRASEYHGLTSKGVYKHILTLAERFSLKTRYDIPLDFLVKSVQFDKKVRGNQLNLVLLSEVGAPYIHKLNCADPLCIQEFFKVLY